MRKRMLETPSSKTRFPLYRKPEKKPAEAQKRPLVDVAKTTSTELQTEIEWVGMEAMELPLSWKMGSEVFKVPALVDGFVSLNDKTSKGIHMSRIYQILLAGLESKELTSGSDVLGLLELLVESQKGLSKSSRLQMSFSLPLRRTALKSEQPGFRSYPISIDGEWTEGKFEFSLSFKVLYSSTCPCSAALSRQLNQEHFLKAFKGKESISIEEMYSWLGEESSVAATPHAQRSEADVQLKLPAGFQFKDIEGWIDQVEEALSTPVQTAVKRADEQEFARLNATNLMFCEDAARRLKVLFTSSKQVKGFYARVRHMESLHPHDAVAIVKS